MFNKNKMNKKSALVIVKVFPILIALILLQWCFESWWQLVDPISYYNGIMDGLPRIIVFIKTIMLTGIIGMSLTTVFGNTLGYQTIKWVLLMSAPITLFFLWKTVPRLWDWGNVGLSIDNWETTEIPIESNGKWNNIYKPILLSLGSTIFIFFGLWLWTRANIKSKFEKQSPIKPSRHIDNQPD